MTFPRRQQQNGPGSRAARSRVMKSGSSIVNTASTRANESNFTSPA